MEPYKIASVSLVCFGKMRSLALYADGYAVGGLAIHAFDEGANEPWGDVTVKVFGTSLADGEVCVKTWSENSDWVPQLLSLLPDVFQDTGRRVSCGFTEAQVWKVNPEYLRSEPIESLSQYKVVVGAHGGNGPELFAVVVECTEHDYQIGMHYDYAQEWALNEGLDGPYFVFDEKDSAFGQCHLRWDDAPIVSKQTLATGETA